MARGRCTHTTPPPFGASSVGEIKIHAQVSARTDTVGGRWGGKLPARDARLLVEDGDAPVEALVDLDHGVRIAALPGIGQELDLVSAEGHRVVVAHRAPILEAEDGLRIETGGPGTIGGGGIRWSLSEARIVASQEAGEEGVGPRAVDDAGEAEFGPQAILEGAKEPLDATLGLRTPGRDPLDGQFLEGPGDLCGCGFADQLLLEGEAVPLAPVEDAMAIAVRGDRDPLGVGERV